VIGSPGEALAARAVVNRDVVLVRKHESICAGRCLLEASREPCARRSTETPPTRARPPGSSFYPDDWLRSRDQLRTVASRHICHDLLSMH
jgi:hypothetical protein